MKRTAHRQEGINFHRFVPVLALVLTAMLPCAQAGGTNQIHDVRIAESQGKTVVSIVGSAKPEFTAYKLSSPSRLVIDIASSRIRGVPTLIDSRTRLLDGVAVSQYTVKGVPVSRIMIGFKGEAAYRVRIKGSTLVATLAGSPSELKTLDTPLPNETKPDTASLARIEKAEQEIAALKLENKKTMESYKDAEAKAAKAQKALESVSASAEAAGKDAAEARRRLDEKERSVELAEKRANAAAAELSRLKKEAAAAEARAAAEGKRADSSNEGSKKELNAVRAELAAVQARLASANAEARRSELALVDSQQEVNRAKEDAKRTAALLKDVEQDALLAKQDAKRAGEEAAAARKEAEAARAAQLRLSEEARRAKAEAKDAEERLAFLKTEASSAKKAADNAESEIKNSKKSADEAFRQAAIVKEELNRLRREATLAKEQADRAEKELAGFRSATYASVKKNADERLKSSQSLSEAKQQIGRLSEQAGKAEAVASEERNKRKNLENKMVTLQAELESARAANQASEASRQKAEAAALALQSKLTEMNSSLKDAQKAAGVAVDDQIKASNAYKKAAKEEQAKLLSILKEKEKETVRAKMHADAVRLEKESVQRNLLSAQKALRDATSVAKAKEENQVLADRALSAANAKLRETSDAMKAWESKAASARLEVARLEREIVDVKAKAAEENSAIRKAGDEKVTAARDALEKAQAAERATIAKLNAAEERLNEHLAAAKRAESQTASLEKALSEAKRAIANRDAEIAKLNADKEKSDLAVFEAKKAAASATEAARIANERAERAAAESKSLAQASAAESINSTGQPALPEVKSENRRMTMEEKRLARLDALSSKNAAHTKGTAKGDAKDGSDVRGTKSAAGTITAVEFESDKDAQKVVISTSSTLEYALSKDPKGNLSLKFKDVKLAPLLERTLDVTDFGGVIGSVSSYQEEKEAVVEVGVSKTALSSVNRTKNRIELMFEEKPDAERNSKTPMAPLGANSRTVAMESGETYAHPHERTAASTIGGGQTGSKKRYTGRHVDLDFKDADIHNILRLLSDVGHVNIITGDDVRGSVTIRMRDVAWDHALDIILQAKQLGMVREGNLIRVAPQSVLEQEREMEIARRKQRIALEPLETRLIPISYATAGELMPRAQDLLSDRGKLSVDARTNVIIARDTKDTLNQIEALIRNLDTQTPQVLIEGRIVEATSLYSREIGIQWGGDFSASSATGNPTGLAFPNSIGIAGGATDGKTPMEGLSTMPNGQPNPNFGVNMPAPVGTNSGGALGITLGSIANNANLSLRLSAMEETGTLRILSSPKILTLDNREAHIEQGTLIPYSQVSAQGVQTAFKEAKLNLTVTPHVTADGSVLLNMRVMRDEPDFNNTGAGGDPTILKREAQTELLVSDGHTAVIGGIFTRNAGTSYKKVPFFADIPIIGWLFKKKSDSDRRSEMLIFITPRIVNRAESIGR